jgi:hypothetical protein
MVEFEVDGRVTRVSIFDPLPLMSKEEYEATYGRSNDSVSIFISWNIKHINESVNVITKFQVKLL